MRILSLAVLAASLLLAPMYLACSSNDGGGSGGGAGSGGSAGSSGGGMGGSAGASGGAAGSGGAGKSCSALGAAECFSNYDCANATNRCENIGSDSVPDVCCVPGARGSKAAGEACNKDTDCKSAICIDLLCSDVCTSVENCPANMKDCKPIAFSGSTDDWCFPTK